MASAIKRKRLRESICLMQKKSTILFLHQKTAINQYQVIKRNFLMGINVAGKKDRILLLHIFTSVDQVIRTNSDVTFLRIGDKTKEIKGKDLKNLEYSKSTRHYEDECNMDAEISDLSEELLAAYKKKIGAEEVDTRRVLKARGFIKKNGKGEYLTNAAVFLFADMLKR